MPGSIIELGNNKFKLIVSCGYKNGPQVRRCKTVEARTKAAANKKLAVFYAQVQAEMKKKHGKNVRPAGRTKMSVADLIDVWSEKYGNTLSPTTAQSDKINIKNNILPYIGRRQADSIKADDVLWLIAELRKRPKMRDPTKKLSETTVHSVYKLLRSIYNRCIEWGLVDRNPCEEIPVYQRPKPAESKTPFYQYDEFKRFMQAVRELKDTPTNVKQKLLLFLAFQDVCRRGEMYALTWDRVDFDQSVFKIEESSYYVPGQGINTKDPKTKSSKRELAFGTRIRELFLKHKENQEAHLKSRNLKNPQNWIFIRTRGIKPGENVKILDLSSFYNWLQDFIARNNFNHMTVHGWRHMGATYSLARGVDLGTVKGNMGHSDLKTTSRYLHPITVAKKGAAREMDNLIDETITPNDEINSQC